ncbi:MAG TPA: helix-turn-helix transcriptional regulator [Pseudonocardiaceae bacterium]|nr:helix-turn-helix transcriptional regulator [Pseudonocardiaceae bacterium]
MAGPTVRRVQLGRELRRLREAAGMERPQVAAAIKTSKSRLAAIELGRNVVSYSELIVLLRDHYNAPGELAALEQMREEAAQRGWWSTYGLSERQAGYIGLEDDALEVRTAEVENIPGLLQTESYMRRLCEVDVRLSGNEVEKRVAVRLQRQARLTGPNPLQLRAVVSEAALMRCSRDQAVSNQLPHLIEAAQWFNVELRVLPFDLGLHVGMAGSFSLLSFPAQTLPDVGYQEYVVGGHVIDDEDVVPELARLFSELRGQALGPTESLAMIAQLAKHP